MGRYYFITFSSLMHFCSCPYIQQSHVCLFVVASTQSMVACVCMGVAARSADFSPDGGRVIVGLTSGEFVVMESGDLREVGRRRDRSGVLQVVRWAHTHIPCTHAHTHTCARAHTHIYTKPLIWWLII